MKYNVFTTYEEGLIFAIIDTMQFMRDHDDGNGYTISMFGSSEKYEELDSFYQEYLDGNKTDAEILQIYDLNKDLFGGKWASIKERLDGKWVYPVYKDEHTDPTEWFSNAWFYTGEE